MIFVTLGTQRFQFDRLLKYIDKQIANGQIDDVVFAQIGNSTYRPQNYDYKDFLDKEEFNNKIKESTLIITHSGVGTIIDSINANKPVIVVPRLKKYGEHIDNHQLQIAESFSQKNFVISNGENIEDLSENIKKSKKFKFEKYKSSNKKIQKIIDEFIQGAVEKNE